MSIRPLPYALVCPQCHWSQAFAPASDVLIEGYDFMSTCPKCGCGKLEHRTASPIEMAAAKLDVWLARVSRRL